MLSHGELPASLRPEVRKPILQRTAIVVVGLTWACMILLGSRALMKYEYGSASPGESPSQCPAHTRIQPPRDKFVLVMVAHPDCPCTGASVAQLEELMTRLNG